MPKRARPAAPAKPSSATPANPAARRRPLVYCDACGAVGHRGQPPFANLPFDLDFTPVPRRVARRDGWSAKKQRDYIFLLADCGSVRDAANAVGMTPESAYALRRAPGAESFCRAWDGAVDQGVRLLHDSAMARAIHGTAIPIFHEGRQVGERRQFNDRLAMFQLKNRMPEKYGGHGGVAGGRLAGDGADDLMAQISEEQLDETRERILTRYCTKIVQERFYREEGNIVAADFMLRQLTHIELVMECGYMAIKPLLDETKRMFGLGEDPNDRREIFGSDLTDALAEFRYAFWLWAGDPERSEDTIPSAQKTAAATTPYSDHVYVQPHFTDDERAALAQIWQEKLETWEAKARQDHARRCESSAVQ